MTRTTGTGPARTGPASSGPTTPRTAGSRTAGEFQRLYGAAPEGVWAAPGRVNLIGEHTDYNDGFVLPFALPQRTEVAASRRTDGILRIHSADTRSGVVTLDVSSLDPAHSPKGADGWAGYPAGVLWALLDADLPVSAGADLHIRSEVPAGAGLSSSAALEVATALALTEAAGLRLSRPEVARLARRAENAYVGVPCGVMDQTASACATDGHVLHLDTRTLAERHLPFDCAAEGLALLVIDTRVTHDLADGAYARRRASCHAAAAALGLDALRDLPPAGLEEALGRLADPEQRARVRHIVTENDRVARVAALLTAGRLRETGPLLTEGHVSLRDDYEVSCPELDLAVATATAAGAYGARMTGGGFGGSALALIDAEAEAAVARAVTEAFARSGFTSPRTLVAAPSAGAGRLA
ncbi:galactokinase [Streptomyces sp. G-G2]|uniref:galactokinase n=1 Tax=Streptomyces sp. G-G2 TaxID=3046201 RepID=UPI0024B91B9D|nr:galactokinase [Streptomyces sp. G-G2]MDJ0379953.1 galactokinase [Streptomyces sp. G-G2]